jgi:uncharacterized RDD family membrane protein YckC
MSQDSYNQPEGAAGAQYSQPANPPAYGYAPPPPAVQAAPDKLKRFLAYFIDCVILGIIAQITIVGAVLAVGGWLARDVVWEGNSVGKKLIGLRAVTAAGTPVTINDSVRRNAIFAAGAVAAVLARLGLFGAVAAMPLAYAAGLLALVEGILVLIDQTRLGDRFANTKVITEHAQPAVA